MPRPVKHHLLYARESWRNSRIWLLGLFVIYGGYGAYTTIRQPTTAHLTEAVVIAVLPLLILAATYANSRVSYVVFGPDRVSLHGPFRRTHVDYTDIEKARTEVVQRLFERPEHKRQYRGVVRRLHAERALCLRVRDDEGEVQRLRKRLGGRDVLDREVVLPITELDAALTTIKSRLSARRAVVSPSPPTAHRPGRGRRRRR